MGDFSTNEDIAFIDQIINAAVSQGLADPTRVYLGGWGDGGFFAQMYAISRSRDSLSVQPAGTCVAAASVYSAADPFNNVSRDDAVGKQLACCACCVLLCSTRYTDNIKSLKLNVAMCRPATGTRACCRRIRIGQCR